MAGIYDERILGAQQQKEFARRLRDQAAEPAGQMVSGWYVPNTGGAVVSALRNMMGAYQENKANEELKSIEREKAQATIQALNKAGIEAPEAYALQAGTPAQQPAFTDRALAFLRGQDQPQATPAIPYQQNVAQNVNPNAMLNLAITNPDMASSALAVQKLKHEQLKEAEQERVKGVPTGFTLNQAGQLVPMPLAGGGNYADWSMDKALAGQRYINPVEAQNMQVQQQRLGLDIQSTKRAEDAAKRAEESAGQQKALKEWEFSNPNANKNLLEIQSAQAANEKLQVSLKNYKDALTKASTEDILNPLKNAELQSIYQSATWPLRDETLMNTGVLNPGEIPMLNKALTDPSSIIGVARGKEELLNQIDKVMTVSNNNAKAIAKSRLPSPPPGMENTPYWTNLKRFADNGDNSKPNEPSGIPFSQEAIQAEIARRKGGQ